MVSTLSDDAAVSETQAEATDELEEGLNRITRWTRGWFVIFILKDRVTYWYYELKSNLK